MASTSTTRRVPGMGAGRALSRRWRRAVRWAREVDVLAMLLLCGASVALAFVQLRVPQIALTALVIPLVVGNLVLSPRRLPWTVVFVLGLVVVVVSGGSAPLDGRRIGGVVVIFTVGLIILVSSFQRTSLGVAGMRGESMLVDLRDRIQKQATMPALPEGWYADAVLRSAGGTSFAGDFMVGSRSASRHLLQVAVVDVSGKGANAGARSLLLSGAFGGLLGALEADAFLPAANDYLVRQDWSEGFATAIHVCLDLETGAFELRSAGHPPGVQLLAGSGRWAVHEPEGPVLGLLPEASFSVVRGTLQHGDALLMFTDGMVETPERDVAHGVERLLGECERLLRIGFEGGAQRLADRLESNDDDRALLLLHRR
jgi:hypothetical protein